MASSYEIGTTEENMVTLDTLVDRDPQPAPAQYAEYATLGNGADRGVGWLEAEWRFFALNTTDIAALRAYCSGVSSSVYITTPDIDGTFTTYTATMIWPQSPQPLHGEFYADFVLRFVELVEVPGTT